MNRRELLASIPLASVATAGCTALSSTDSDDAGFVSDAPLSAYGCPPSGIEESGFVCTDSNGSDRPAVTLRSSTEQSDAATNVDLIVHNGSETRTLEFNPCNWTVWVEELKGWNEVEGGAGCQGYVTVPPGETYGWNLEWLSDYIGGQEFTFSAGTYFVQSPLRERRLATLFRITDE